MSDSKAISSMIEQFDTRKSKVILLGDSITQGLGSKKVNFTERLKAKLNGTEVVNHAYTGTTITYPFQIIEDIDIAPGDIVVVLYGNVDAQIRPSQKGMIFPKIPSRFRQPGMLMPRPFYSDKLYKRFFQLMDNMIRLVLSRLIVAIDGTEQWVPLSEFGEKYRELIQVLLKKRVRIICCSCVYIDEALFPKTPDEYRKYSAAIDRLAKDYGAIYVDLYSKMEELVVSRGWDYLYNRDHFHPNGCGYEHMANWLESAVRI